MKNPFYWLIFLAFIQPQQLLGADSLSPIGSGLSELNQSGLEKFLPVEEAYQLYPRHEGNTLVLDWVIAPGYYLYKEQFTSAIVGEGHDEVALEQIFAPGVVRYDDYYEKDVEVYYTGTTVEATLPASTSSGFIKVTSQGCADAGLCYPPRALFVALDSSQSILPVIDNLPSVTPVVQKSAPTAENTPIMVILGFALLGGLILNLMPCVFPVLSIKVLSLSQHHLSSHGRHIHGVAYSIGVIASFLAIAMGLITLRAGGEALGWGFQLQSPGFITALVYLFFVMGLSFSGYFEAGTRLMNLGQSAAAGNDLHHSFLAGVLATVVASPCSAPFMGTALGFALTQTTPVALLVFAFLGLGMALPFLLLTWAPSLLNRIPKPGPWMDTLKGLLSFPLYLTAIWLLWILGNQTDADVTAMVLCGLTLIVFAIWLGRHRTATTRAFAAIVTVAALLLPVKALVSEQQQPLWQSYSPTQLETLLDQRQPVFINLTADWCITCLANEKIALNSDSFRQTLAEENITYLKGDWTNESSDITTLLNANGRSGVPLYLFYPAGQRQPVILPQILTTAIVRDALTGR